VYSTCLHCTKSLGTNDVFETLPIGRRVAFDADKGRLWVVCRECARWNLVPFDTRLESIDACERLYRDTPTRYATDNIGLARTKEGLELVRIGQPLRPEFASWRYGDSFGRRRRRTIVRVASLTAVGGAAVAGGLAAGVGVGMLVNGWQMYNMIVPKRRATVRVPRVGGTPIELSDELLPSVAFLEDAEAGWVVRARTLESGLSGWWRAQWVGKQFQTFAGDDAEALIRGALTRINRWGGNRQQIAEAAELASSYASHEELLSRAQLPKSFGKRTITLAELPTPWRLGAEMVLHEHREREALDGQLKLLEREWREAEQLAKIADDLVLTREE
jgi:hypothetical protein